MLTSLYILLPGGCNAHCDFCCWERKHEPFTRDQYVDGLEFVLSFLYAQSHSINILGGEPLISPHLIDVLSMIRNAKFPIPKVVLTTNGSELIQKLKYFKGAVNHVNLSRHAIFDEENKLIFGRRAFLQRKNILKVAESLIDMDIDLSINCVLHEKTPLQSKGDILDFIEFAKDSGAVAVCFKKLEGDSLENTPQQNHFLDIPVIRHSSCDVCRTDTQIINDMVVYWQAALNRPSSEVRDLIIQPNLAVTSDWAGNNIAWRL